MKIAFICGSLEPGYDGVGDYTRRLAGELKRQGNQIYLISLNEKKLESVFLQEEQETEGSEISVLRISGGISYRKRFLIAKRWIDTISPDWLSLQYVPFSFHPKGAHFFFGKFLRRLGRHRKWHIMFHELWTGMDEESSKKHYWLGKIHRLLIKSLIRSMKPSVIHTQTHVYLEKLGKLGYKAYYLPLFSNIPFFEPGTISKSEDKYIDQEKKLLFVLFGGIHGNAPVAQLASDLVLYEKANKTRIILVIIGRSGPMQKQWTSIWALNGLEIVLMGEQSPRVISKVLHSANIGISTTPIQLAEKSGSVAAMREHQLPILCVSRAWKARGIKNPELPESIVEYESGKLEECLAKAFECKFVFNKISEVSYSFSDALTSSN
jgi:hypothetical protein